MIGKFKCGDVVCRPLDVFDPRSPMRFGIVTRVHCDLGSRFGPYLELYEVTWDGGEVGRAYLPHGLWPADKTTGTPYGQGWKP